MTLHCRHGILLHAWHHTAFVTSNCTAGMATHCMQICIMSAYMHGIACNLSGSELQTCNALPAMLHSVQLLKVVFTPIPWQLQLWADLHTNAVCKSYLTGMCFTFLWMALICMFCSKRYVQNNYNIQQAKVLLQKHTSLHKASPNDVCNGQQ